MSEHNGRIKQEVNSRPQSPRSRSPSPKSDSNEREIKSESDQTKRVLKEIGNENGKDGITKEDNTDDEDDVNILKEKLRKLEDDSKCSKCMVIIFISNNEMIFVVLYKISRNSKYFLFPPLQNTLKNPVVNVGCWHVQCQKCWLISLVSTTKHIIQQQQQ